MGFKPITSMREGSMNGTQLDEIKERMKSKKKTMATNFPYIFLSDMNFDKSTIRLHFLIMSSIFVKFQED